MRTTLLLVILSCLLSFSLAAQSVVSWDGEGTTTNWEEAANWSGDAVPTAADTVDIGVEVTVTGTATIAPVAFRVSGGVQVTLDLDLTVGDGATAGNTVELSPAARLVLENDRTLNLLPEENSNGIQIGSGDEGTTLNVKGRASLVISGGRHGISINNMTAEITQRGTSTISGTTGNGIRLSAGKFRNLGSLTISDTGGNGVDIQSEFVNEKSNSTALIISNASNNAIRLTETGSFLNQKDVTITSNGATNDGLSSEGTVTNDTTGLITITATEDDGIDQTAGTFLNDGTINITVRDGASSGNNGLAVGSDVAAATFTNRSNNTLAIDGGVSDSRGIVVGAMGTLNNTGTITLTNGDDGGRLTNDGTFTNDLQGRLEVTDGRVNNSSNLVNNGYIVSTATTPGVFNTGTATNNGFFRYDGSNNFANGSGTVTDLGINLNQSSSRIIDGAGSEMVKIANAQYTYLFQGDEIGTTDAEGNLMIDCATLGTAQAGYNISPVGLDLGSPGVRLRNVCQVLPVELTHFSGKGTNKSVLLEWTTASEIGNDFMAVQHSTDGERFTEIGRIAGAGTSTLLNRYTLRDDQPAAGQNFYRLRQVDFDGTEHMSHVISVRFAGEVNGEVMSLYPTVVGNGQPLTVTIDGRENQFTTLTIIDANGRALSSTRVTPDSSANIDVSPLPAGIYYLSTTLNSQRYSKRFIVR